MSSISQAFDSPVLYREDGLDLSFPKLDCDDHCKWTEEIHAAKKPVKLKMIPGNATPIERFKLTRNVEFETPTLDDIADMIYTMPGARTAILKSLEKMGKTGDEASVILKKIKPARMQRLAMDVSGLFETLPPALPTKNPAGANPLAQPGSPSEVTSTPATGDGPGSSSASTSANPSDK